MLLLDVSPFLLNTAQQRDYYSEERIHVKLACSDREPILTELFDIFVNRNPEIKSTFHILEVPTVIHRNRMTGFIEITSYLFISEYYALIIF